MSNDLYRRLLKLSMLQLYSIGHTETFDEWTIEEKQKVYAAVDTVITAMQFADTLAVSFSLDDTRTTQEHLDEMAKRLMKRPDLNPLFQ